MTTPIIDTSSMGVVEIKDINACIIKASKASSGDVFADLKLQAFNSNLSKNVTMTLSNQSDTPKLTLTPQGVVATGVVISGIADSTDTTSMTNRGTINTHTTSTSTHGVTGNIVGTGGNQTLTNKIFEGVTITHDTNNAVATGLKTSDGVVTISASGTPSLKHGLVANDPPTTAKWDVLPYVPVEIEPIYIDLPGPNFEYNPGTDLYTIRRHAIYTPAGNSAYLINNPSVTFFDNSEHFETMKSTGNLVFNVDPSIHFYRPGYNGTPGGSFTLDGGLKRGMTTKLKKRNNTEWILMNLYD